MFNLGKFSSSNQIIKILSITAVFVLISFSVPSFAESDVILYYSSLDEIKSDSTIDQDEYAQTVIIPNYKNEFQLAELSWSHNTTHIAVGIVAKLTGFIGFGINEKSYQGNAMVGANMIISSVDSDGLTIGDYHAEGQVIPINDTDQYGSLDLASGREANGETTVEFIIPMASSDPNDITMEVDGEYTIFIAGHGTSDELIYHENWHTQPHSVVIRDESLIPSEKTVTIELSELEIPLNEVFYVVIFFSGIIFLLYRNRLTARY